MTITSEQTHTFDLKHVRFFKMSLGNTLRGENAVYNHSIFNNEIALGWGRNIDFSNCHDKQAIRILYESSLPKENPYGVEFLERFKNVMQIGDIVVISNGNRKARAIGMVTCTYKYRAVSPIPYHHFRTVQWLYENNEIMIPVQNILLKKYFSQQTVYMLNNKDLNMESIQNIIGSTNVFKPRL